MSTTARKARKRAGLPFSKPAKKRTRLYGKPVGLGLVSSQELIAALVVRGLL